MWAGASSGLPGSQVLGLPVASRNDTGCFSAVPAVLAPASQSPGVSVGPSAAGTSPGLLSWFLASLFHIRSTFFPALRMNALKMAPSALSSLFKHSKSSCIVLKNAAGVLDLWLWNLEALSLPT